MPQKTTVDQREDHGPKSFPMGEEDLRVAYEIHTLCQMIYAQLASPGPWGQQPQWFDPWTGTSMSTNPTSPDWNGTGSIQTFWR